MPTCKICAIEKPDDAFRHHKSGKPKPDCIDCETILKARRKGNATIVEKLLQVEPQELPSLPVGPAKRLEMAVGLRMEFYKSSALEALHDLAVMPIIDNSAMMQVKFMAASRLAGPAIEGERSNANGPNFDTILKDLNDRFHMNAPRIRSVRERITTFDEGPPAIESSLQQ